MSTYMLMKILESQPSCYDRGIKILTLGSLEASYDRIALHIKKGDRVLRYRMRHRCPDTIYVEIPSTDRPLPDYCGRRLQNPGY